MKKLLFLVMLCLLTPIASWAETSPTLRLAPVAMATVGAREILATEVQLSAEELSAARRRFVPARFAEWEKKASARKASKALIDAAVTHHMQETGVAVSDEEIAEWVKAVRAKGEANRQRELLRMGTNKKVLEERIAAATDPAEVARLKEEKAREDAKLANLEKALDLDNSFESFYPGMGLMFLTHYKSRKALHKEFGGKIYQVDQIGEPLDAIEAMVKKLEAEGAITYKDDALRSAVHSYFAEKGTFRQFSPEEEQAWIEQQPY